MAILETLVIATIILAGAWVGYHAWQDSLHEKAESHNLINDHDILQKHIQLNIYNNFDLGFAKINLH